MGGLGEGVGDRDHGNENKGFAETVPTNYVGHCRFVDFIVNVVLAFRNTSNQFYKMATKRLLAQHGTLCILLTVSYW